MLNKNHLKRPSAFECLNEPCLMDFRVTSHEDQVRNASKQIVEKLGKYYVITILSRHKIISSLSLNPTFPIGRWRKKSINK